MFVWPYDSPRRGASTKTRPFGEWDACIRRLGPGGRALHRRAPGDKFRWWRARMVGGRTNHWGRIPLRFGPRDFKGKSSDGLGDDWPISYEDVRPYYDRVDRLIGVFGSKDGLPQRARLPVPPGSAPPALLRAARPAGGAPTRCHLRLGLRLLDPHAAADGPGGLSLLRPVRPRVRAALEFLVAVGADPAGDGDQEADDRRQRDGARSDGRRNGQGHRRRLHRQEHRARESRPGAHRRARRERVRVGAPPPQLQVVEVSAGPRQFDRQRRQVPDRHHGPERSGASSRS